MAVSVYKTFIAGEVLTAADLNASLTQITDNGQSVGFPRTSSADFDGQTLILDSDGDSNLDCATDDILDLNLRGQTLFLFDGATDGTTVDGLTFYAAAAGNDVQILAQGSSTNIDIDIVPKGSGSVLLDGTAVGTVISRDTGTGTTNVPLVSDILGEHTIWVPASAMSPATTSGCSALTQTELTAGRPELLTLDFDGSSVENAFFSVSFPKGWNEGTITAQFYYTVSAAVVTTVNWDIAGVAISDDDSIDTAYGSAQSAVAAFHGTSNDLAVSSETSAVTIAGTPAEGDLVYFKVDRNPGADTTTQDARLIGVKIFYTINALNDS